MMTSPCLLLDVGNSRLAWAYGDPLAEGVPQLKECQHFDLQNFDSESLKQAVADSSWQGHQVVMASVNPDAASKIRNAFEAQGKSVCELGRDLPLREKVVCDHPQDVGIDRVMNAVAVRVRGLEPALVVDHGTALTLDYVNPEGCYAGGCIAPGLMMQARSLFEKTALLPDHQVKKPDQAIGWNTHSCIESGVYHGFVGGVINLIEKVKSERPEPLKVVATGGGFSQALRQDIPLIDLWLPHLTLEGVMISGQPLFSSCSS